MKPVAIIVGSDGQDGQLLKIKLKSLDYSIVGITKNTIDITNPKQVSKLISKTKPKEIYFLAAFHHSSEEDINNDRELFCRSIDIHVTATVNFLDAITFHSPLSRFFYSSSCLVFAPSDVLQSEYTELKPDGPYGISKAAGMLACQYYRERKKVYASIGILYNHESSLRAKNFVSRKIISSAARIARERKGHLKLGNLEAQVDWGYAPDYVDAMHRILKLDKPNDFIVATGKSHSVNEFSEIAFSYFGLDHRKYVKTDKSILVRENLMRIGDSSRLRKATGWSPTISFEAMVRKMATEEAELINEE